MVVPCRSLMSVSWATASSNTAGDLEELIALRCPATVTLDSPAAPPSTRSHTNLSNPAPRAPSPHHTCVYTPVELNTQNPKLPSHTCKAYPKLPSRTCQAKVPNRQSAHSPTNQPLRSVWQRWQSPTHPPARPHPPTHPITHAPALPGKGR